MKRFLLLVVMILALTAGYGCTQKSGDQGAEIKEGTELMKEGVEEGKEMMKEGEGMMEEGKEMMKEGEGMMEEGQKAKE